MTTEPALVYDGDCAFCTRCVNWLMAHLTTDARVVAWQQVDLASLGATAGRAQHEMLWIASSGEVYGGAQAFDRLLTSSHGPWAVLGWLLRVPPVRWLAAWVYRRVADHRHLMPGGTAECALQAGRTPG